MIEAPAVTKVFDGTRALDEVDFRATPGTVTALFGENGAGKSTLMKILAGIETPTAGHVELDGLDEPSRGVDVGAKADVFALMAGQAEHGLAVLFTTSEAEEALRVPDRLLVLARGRLVGEFRRGEISMVRSSAVSTSWRGRWPTSASAATALTTRNWRSACAASPHRSPTRAERPWRASASRGRASA
jgi:ABC-type sugar transport system ATPase subunit